MLLHNQEALVGQGKQKDTKIKDTGADYIALGIFSSFLLKKLIWQSLPLWLFKEGIHIFSDTQYIWLFLLVK